MATVMGSDSISDEEWVVIRSQECLKTDQYAAKAWMITAKTLYPRNFLIQFESYQLEKDIKNTKEAARMLEEMFHLFPHETKLWDEIRALLASIQMESTDSKNLFLTELFAAIPTQIQCQMLLNIAVKISDILEQCRLLLLAMKKFPNLVSEHGLKLVETLSKAEKYRSVESPVNCYRKLLVCDVLPLVLKKCKHIEVPTAHLYKWLQKAIEFYITYLTHQHKFEPTMPLSPDLLSPTKKTVAGRRTAWIPGLNEKECYIGEPWNNLFKFISLIGCHLGWESDKDLQNQTRDSQWQYVFSLYTRARQLASETLQKQVLYTTVILFLDCLYTYITYVDSDCITGATTQQPPLVLIEAFKTDQEDLPAEPRMKKLRHETSQPQIHSFDTVAKSRDVIQNFTAALKCYELLYSSDELRKEFMSLCQSWQMETWSWMAHFQTDMFIYRGAFKEATSHLKSVISGMKGKLQENILNYFRQSIGGGLQAVVLVWFCTMEFASKQYTICRKSGPVQEESQKMRTLLQLACCYFCLGNYSKSCEIILDIVSNLPQASHDEPVMSIDQLTAQGPGRHLLLTTCSEQQLLPYCIFLILSCLKEKTINSSQFVDNCYGNLVVLLQYDWPKQENLFSKIVEKIQNHGSLTYNNFFNYVINVDILEDFSFLKTVEGGKVNLDILSLSTNQITQQRTITRGVNKGVKEDFKVTMERQVSRSDESNEKLIRQFLKEEKHLILNSLQS